MDSLLPAERKEQEKWAQEGKKSWDYVLVELDGSEFQVGIIARLACTG
jgi:hypothetical protein